MLFSLALLLLCCLWSRASTLLHILSIANTVPAGCFCYPDIETSRGSQWRYNQTSFGPWTLVVKNKETHREDQKGDQGFASHGVTRQLCLASTHTHTHKAWPWVGLIRLSGTCYRMVMTACIVSNHLTGQALLGGGGDPPSFAWGSLTCSLQSCVPETPQYLENWAKLVTEDCKAGERKY